MARRVNTYANHLKAIPAAAGVGIKGPDDVVVVWCKRTAIGRAGKGSFK